MKRFYLLITSILFIVTFSAVCHGAIPSTLREGSRPFFFGLGIGPTIGLHNAPTQLLLTQTFGYHFFGDASGPAIAFDLQEHVAGGLFVLQVNPRFVWDVRIVPGLGFYISPSVGIGYTFTNGGPHHGLTIPVLLKLKLVVGDRGYVFFQPIGLDMMPLFYPGDRYNPSHSYFAMQYDLLFGGGIIF